MAENNLHTVVPGEAPPAGGSGGAVATHGPRPHHVSGRSRRRLVVLLLLVFGLGGVVAAAGVLTGFLPNPVVAGDPKASGRGEPSDTGPLAVKVVRPTRDASFRITTRQFAVVEPYYQAGLRARVTGIVNMVAKDIGEPVRAGELLVDIDVPDLKSAVEQKEAVIVQREKELISSTADLAVAKSAVTAAEVGVKFKTVDVDRAKDVVAARKLDLDALTELFKTESAVKSKLDAAALEHHAAERGVQVAEAEVEKAKVELAGKAASLEKARADVELKRAMVEVARKDRDAAAMQLGYCRLYAPFDGVIVSRQTDPGRFVSAGSGGSTEPLITVARTDLVTVVAKVPDNAAPFVSWETEATVEFEQLPGVVVRGPITRYSQAIDPADQTMRVEVDVYNGSLEDYRAMLARAGVPGSVGPLLPFDRFASIAATGAGLFRNKAYHKGWQDRLAGIPDWGPEGRYRRIVPGTTASMRLDLEKFGESYLLPSKTIFGRAGQSYILVVDDGVTRAVPVAVQMNDGTTAKVAVVVPAPNGRQVTRELTGKEVIVTTRQLEVGEGRRVTPVFEK
jgi:multidrug resistance efflux pump